MMRPGCNRDGTPRMMRSGAMQMVSPIADATRSALEWLDVAESVSTEGETTYVDLFRSMREFPIEMKPTALGYESWDELLRTELIRDTRKPVEFGKLRSFLNFFGEVSDPRRTRADSAPPPLPSLAPHTFFGFDLR